MAKETLIQKKPIVDPKILAKKKRKEQILNFYDFDSIRISIASPDDIRNQSYGEVRKAETINYRTLRPERDGLFCERIFGPTKDWQCACGKYKFERYKTGGVICDRCGVEVTESEVRRERMGHIELAAPCVHIWYLKKSPSRIGLTLDIKMSDLEKVTYYIRYLVLEDLVVNGKIEVKAKDVLTEEEYREYKNIFGEKFKAGSGGEAIMQLLSKVDLKQEAKKVREQLKKIKQETERLKKIRRLQLLENFITTGIKPEWMVLTVLPVLPPELRPLVALESGRFTSSDLNDFYRRIINRNNRLKKVILIKAPELIIQNEKRLLQEVIDALIENGANGRVLTSTGGRPLKSLVDNLKGKQGRFRLNLLGKRIDYSGRSVIVVGPHLKLHQCGLPKEMALELFKPMVIYELNKLFEQKGERISERKANRILEKPTPEIWDILEKVSKNYPILLNRAPTLHRVSIQAFEPVLVEGKSIQLHPLVCAAFNADFDGDQMAVYVPLTLEAQLECRMLLMSTMNIFSPASGKPLAAPTQDIVAGINYLTIYKPADKGEGKIFSSFEEVEYAYSCGIVGLHAKIKLAGLNNLDEGNNPDNWKDFTTVGRVLFNTILPEKLRFINKELKKKDLTELVKRCYFEVGHPQTVKLLDTMKSIGFHYATLAGLTMSVVDFTVPPQKWELIKEAQKQVGEINRQASAGIITELERYNAVIDLWSRTTEEISLLMLKEMEKSNSQPYTKDTPFPFNATYIIMNSGARGSESQVRQLAGMRGLMARPQEKITGRIGEIIETPVISNLYEGLNVLEYFISTHGGRKGLADTALKTSDAGYLTRRLVDVVQDVVITALDCKTKKCITVGPIQTGEEIIETLEERIIGRVALDNITIPLPDEKGELKEERVIKAGDLITPQQAKLVAESGLISKIRVRSPLTCELDFGICAKCYGLDLSKGQLANLGDAVGIIAAQSIGEPGTQLTLRTFHIGGTASTYRQKSQIIATKDAKVEFENDRYVISKHKQKICVSRNASVRIKDVGEYKIPYGAKVFVNDADIVKQGTIIAEWDPFSMPIIAENAGVVKWHDLVEGVTLRKEKNYQTGMIDYIIIEHQVEKKKPSLIVIDKDELHREYPLPVETYVLAENNSKIEAGDVIAKIPQEVIKIHDITGGLPRIEELFEARKPKNSAILSEVSGIVSLGITQKGATKVVVTTGVGKTAKKYEYIIPHGKHIMVYEGDKVKAGDPLTDGPINPHDILNVKGIEAVEEFLVSEIQKIYRLQGVTINDKHIEIVIRQMLSHVRILDGGSTTLVAGEILSRSKLKEIVEKEKNMQPKEKLKEPKWEPVLLGITKASLLSDSFIAASSFQETTRILTEAATKAQVDTLRGLKENVIIGHCIPAGTGFPENRFKFSI